ncbi:hypothetical protein F5Y17DRAFT_465556 [Xylariaceae sp. FL0594]|nr:hypothetical protein F5Y17DRAFT_465556 [Xylariaceae sp. FL0594]
MSEKPVSRQYADEEYYYSPRDVSRDSADQESRGLINGVYSGSRLTREGEATWQSSRRCLVVVTVLNAFLFISTATLLGIWYHENYLVKNPELRRVSIPSPVLDSVDLNLHTITINGSLLAPADPTLARQMPNPVADQQWGDYELVRPIALTSAQIRSLGKDPRDVAKLEDSAWGLGDDAYVADLDVFHQLHCLNTLRKLAYARYYNSTLIDYSSSSKASSVDDERNTTKHDHPSSKRRSKHGHSNSKIDTIHVNHCVDMLFTAITCAGNVGFITSNWVEGVKYPQPDMSINRKCVDFERLVEWRNQHTIDMAKYERVMMYPPGKQTR